MMDDVSQGKDEATRQLEKIIDQQSRQIDADQKALDDIWHVLVTDWSLTGLEKIQSIIHARLKSQVTGA